MTSSVSPGKKEGQVYLLADVGQGPGCMAAQGLWTPRAGWKKAPSRDRTGAPEDRGLNRHH